MHLYFLRSYPLEGGGHQSFVQNFVVSFLWLLLAAAAAPPNGEKLGEKNGTSTGLVGELQKDISDIGLANLFMLPERLVS